MTQVVSQKMTLSLVKPDMGQTLRHAKRLRRDSESLSEKDSVPREIRHGSDIGSRKDIKT